jgi:GT2 family glycosyltransferase
MSITAIIPVWNGRDLLERLLRSVESQTLPAAEIVVVDNGSSDGAPEFARERGARVISMGRNAGFAAAMNRGIRESRTEWVAALNSDVELEPGYFAALTAAADDEDAWFATGRLLSGRAGGGGSARPATMDGAFDLICRGGAAWRAGSGRRFGPPFDRRRPIHSAPWTAALFRTALFDRIGALEESFESYLGDVDFGMRCAREGIAGVYEPAATAWHVGSATGGRWSANTVRLLARNQAWLLARHYPDASLRRHRSRIRTARVLWCVLAIRHGRARAWLQGTRQGSRGFAGARAGSTPWAAEHLEEFLAQGEREIAAIQALTGFDWFWKMYFRLTRGEAK